MKILLVEDNVAQLENLQLILAGQGCKVSVAQNATAARAIAEVHCPDVVVLDIVLPDDAVQFLDWLKTTPEMEKTRVVVTTGLSEVPERVLQYGVPVLMKPYKVDELLRLCTAETAE